MFEGLTESIGKTLRNLRGVGKLTEENTAAALDEVRRALLASDVHFKVAREFTDRVKKKCIGTEVIKSVTPGQHVIKIISDELEELLGGGSTELSPLRPLKIMMVGLHGSGKTTSSAKLAALLKKRGMKPALIACDVYRPAAIDQLEQLGARAGVAVYSDRNERNVPKLAENLARKAVSDGANAVIFDTAGRLQIDEALIDEIKELRAKENPAEVLLVADAALGQEAVNVAKAFNDAVQITGVVLSNLDGDARGGAALSIKSVSGAPIKFAGTGEKLDDFEIFHPDRMAQRILGMGDVVSLVEKAQENIDMEEAERMAEKMRKAEFDFDDLLSQMRQMKNMGPIGGLVKLIPGLGSLNVGEKEEREMRRTEAIILSMTPDERKRPNILNARRRLRIASGSGTQVRDVNMLVKRLEGMKSVMKMMRGAGGKRRMAQMMRNLPKRSSLLHF